MMGVMGASSVGRSESMSLFNGSATRSDAAADAPAMSPKGFAGGLHETAYDCDGIDSGEAGHGATAIGVGGTATRSPNGDDFETEGAVKIRW